MNTTNKSPERVAAEQRAAIFDWLRANPASTIAQIRHGLAYRAEDVSRVVLDAEAAGEVSRIVRNPNGATINNDHDAFIIGVV